MSRTDPQTPRGELRAWLTLALRSGLFDRLPPLDDPDGDGRGVEAVAVARSLLADLKDPDGAGRPLTEVLAEARAFRLRVEARQRTARRIIMAGAEPEEEPADLADYVPRRKPPAGTAPQPSSHRPQDDPLWDRWTDG